MKEAVEDMKRDRAGLEGLEARTEIEGVRE